MVGQLGIWYAQLLGGDNSIYNIAEYLDIRGDLDVALFEEALRHTTREVGAYGLRFRENGRTPQQWIDDPGDWPLPFLDVSSAPDPQAAAEEWMREEISHPVDLREGPVFSYALFKIADRRHFWYHRVHHVASDGVGGAIITARLGEVYAAMLAGSVPADGALDPVSMLMDDEAAYRASADFERDREFWLGQLAGLPEVLSVTGEPVPRMTRMPIRVRRDVDPVRVAGLKDAARQLRTSFAGLMIAAAVAYVHGISGATDIVIGLPVIGRTGARQRRIPGMTTNMLPIRLRLETGMSVVDLVRQASKAVREALRHQRYRYEDMMRDLRLINSGTLFGLIVNVMSFDYAIRFGECEAVAHNLDRKSVV